MRGKVAYSMKTQTSLLPSFTLHTCFFRHTRVPRSLPVTYYIRYSLLASGYYLSLLRAWGVLLLCLGHLLPFLCLVILHSDLDCVLSEHAAVELHWWKRQVLRNLAAKKTMERRVDRRISTTTPRNMEWDDHIQADSKLTCS